MRYNFGSVYVQNCLKPLSNRPEAVFKQRKPCSNNGIHVLFEQFLPLLGNPQDGQKFVCMMLSCKISMLLAKMMSLMFDFAR